MRKIKIVADTSCDLLSLSYASYAYAPMKVTTAERDFVDNADLNVEEMVEYLYNYKGASRSSCPNTNDWLDAFGDGDDIFCVTITGGLSGSYNSACSAKNVYESENEGKRVFVIDSLSAGPECTMIVEKLEDCIRQGLSYEDICQKIGEYTKHTALTFMLKSLKNFANNGRISPLVAKLVGMAGICIVGRASTEGTLEPLHKCRGEKRSLEAIVEEMASRGFVKGKVSIGHCMNPEGAQALKELLLSKHPEASITIHKLHGLCSFYAEKGGILVGYEME